MRFISKYRRYKLTVREHVTMTLANGKTNVIQQGIIAEFRHGGVLPNEQAYARQLFKVKGMNQEEDEATPVDPFSGPGNRLSVYDTGQYEKAWAQIERLESLPAGSVKQEVEEFLLGYQTHGQDYAVVEVAKVPAPWPAYDKLVVHGQRKIEHVVEKIVTAIQDLGVDPQDVLAYERQEKNRPEVVAAVEGLFAEDEPEPLIAA